MNTEQEEVVERLAQEFYENAALHGFHNRDDEKSLIDNYDTWTSNLHDEVSELHEAAREGKLEEPCNKPILLTCEEEELADIAIRVFDTAKARGVNIGRAIRIKSYYNRTRPYMHGNKLC